MKRPVLHGDRSTRLASYVVWGLFLVAFLALEILGLERRRSALLRKIFPQFTASETGWAVEAAIAGDGRSLPRRLANYALRAALFLLGVSLGSHFALGTPLFPFLGH
jgi:hypothetical protein